MRHDCGHSLKENPIGLLDLGISPFIKFFFFHVAHHACWNVRSSLESAHLGFNLSEFLFVDLLFTRLPFFIEELAAH